MDSTHLDSHEIIADEHYGFDFAVYPINKDNKHTHSIALIKKIQGQTFREV
jgi:hypothetical protein